MSRRSLPKRSRTIAEPGSMVEPYLREVGCPESPGAAHSGSWVVEPEHHERTCLETYLFLAGRMSGRFIDHQWLAEDRTLYTIPLSG
ncbi:hypothetical protein ACFY3V_03420 [Streptosporangium sp. NPDC000095]|uniref:hypothetical protein n=1 Tax=Streptosporangium sp. NPDC000095 TaxID=3366184 RepID=UPI0036A6D3F6